MHALFYLDLDQFKVVNDTCGHVAGDELLRQLSQTLLQRLRRGDTLARLGGDEFGILLENCPPREAMRVARDLLQVVQRFRFTWMDKSFSLGACIGVVDISADTESMTTALQAADTACFTAKEKGRNRIHLYQADDADLTRRQGEMQWVAHITSALEEDRFCLYYQPIVALQDAAVEEHWEMLLRLKDPDGSIIPPGVFIPAAERYNLMPAVDRWVIRNVIAWCARRLEAAPERPLPVCGINLSGVTFSDQALVGFIRDTLAEHEVPPACLCFEITETAAIANINEAVQFIVELKELGCRFALDDFGSGMSSFAYLKNLPVDFLKIDGNFVRAIVDDPVDHVMVEAINRVGQVMGIRTIAEYVENDEIRSKLTQLGVDFGQGYGIARPRPIEDAGA
jgi:diguanylate cyclase (GGDEF)-like protein